MASLTEEKVVQLTLDNKHFDKNVESSVQSLDKLKKSLEFEGQLDAFDKLEKEVKRVDMSPLERGIEKVQTQFNLLNTIADTVFRRITNAAIDTGVNLVKSLSVDQVGSGWNQYEERNSAVQRITAATAQQFEDEREQMEAVSETLSKLTWFTDETSYKFLDMANNMGKFTANNVELETSARAMQGISTWASRSGASIEESGRAMYNLAQAIAVGSVKLIDWKSIENANMATTEFKNTAIETALELGSLTKTADGFYQAVGGKDAYSALELFSDGLKDAWFNSDVLLKTLDKYGGYADELYKFTNATGLLTTNAIEMVEEFIDGTLDMEAAMDETGMTAEELGEWLEKLGSDEYDLGRKAFAAAQETKSLSEAIDYVKTAVSSGWATTFSLLFGDYKESKAWWSEVAEGLYEVFVEAGETRNAMLELWASWGGRDDLLQAFRELGSAIKEVLDIVGEAWDAVWPQDVDEKAKRFSQLTEAFLQFAESLHLTDSSAKNLRTIFTALFRTAKNLWTVISKVAKAFAPLLDIINKVAGAVVYLIAVFAELINIRFEKWVDDGGFAKLLDFVTKITEALSKLAVGALAKVIEMVAQAINILFDFYDAWQRNGGGISGILATISTYLDNFFNQFLQGETIVNRFVDITLGLVVALANGIITVLKNLGKVLKGELSIKDMFSTEFTEGLEAVVETIENSGVFKLITDKFLDFAKMFRDFAAQLFQADSEIRISLTQIGQDIKDFFTWVKDVFREITIDDVKDIALILILWSFVNSLNSIGAAMKSGINNVTGLFGTLNNILKEFTGQKTVIDKLNSLASATKTLQLGVTAMLIVNSLAILNTLDYDKTISSIAMLTIAGGALLVAYKKFEEITTLLNKSKAKLKELTGDEKKGTSGIEMLAMAASVSVIISTVTLLVNSMVDETNGINWDKVKVAGAGIGVAVGVILAMTMALKALDKVDTKSLKHSAAILISMALAIDLMIPAITSIAGLANLNWKKLTLAIVSIDSIILSMALLFKAVDKGKNSASQMLAIGAAFIELAAAIDIMTVGLIAIAFIPTEGLANNFSTLAIMFGEMAVSLGLLGYALRSVNANKIMAVGSAMISLAAALDLIAAAFVIFDKVAGEDMKNAWISLGVTFAAMTGSLILMAKLTEEMHAANVLAIGSSMMMLATSLVEVAAAFLILGEVDWDAINDNLSTITIAFGVFLGLLPVLLGIISAIAGPLAGTAGIATVAEAFVKLGEGFEKLGIGILAAAGALAVLNIAFQTTIAMAAGLGIIAQILDEIGISLEEAVDRGMEIIYIAIDSLLDTLIKLAPKILAIIAMIWVGIQVFMQMKKDETTRNIVAWGLAIMQALITAGPEIIDKLGELLDVLNTNLPRIQSNINDLMNNLGDMLIESLASVLAGGLRGLFKSIFGGIGGIFGEDVQQDINDTFDIIFGTAADKAAARSRSNFEALMKILADDSKAYAHEQAAEMLEAMLKSYEEGDRALSERQYEAGKAVFDAFRQGHIDEGNDPNHEYQAIIDETEYMADSYAKGTEQNLPTYYDSGRSAMAATHEGQMDEIAANQDELNKTSAASSAQAVKSGVQETLTELGEGAAEIKEEVKEIAKDTGETAATDTVESLQSTMDAYDGALGAMGEALGKLFGTNFTFGAAGSIDANAIFGGLFNISSGGSSKTGASKELYSGGEKMFGRLVNETMANQDWLYGKIMGSIENMNADMFQGLYDSAKASGLLTSTQLESIYNKANGTAKKAAKEATTWGDDIATNFSSGVTKAASKGSSGTKTAKTTATKQVDEVAQAYKDAISKIDMDAEISELQYKLWSASNVDATEAEKKEMELAQLTDQINYQIARVNAAEKQYVDQSTALGENSEEALAALKTYLKAQIELVDLQNQATETTSMSMAERGDAFVEASRKYSETMDLIKDMGFSKEDQLRYWNRIMGEYGLNDLQRTEEEIKQMAEKLEAESQNTGNVAGSMIRQSMQEPLAEAIDAGYEAGGALPGRFVEGYNANANLIDEALSATKENAKEIMEVNDTGSGTWYEVGENIDKGVATGIEENADEPKDEAVDMADNLIDAAKKELGIASPSTVFKGIGDDIIAGLVNAIEAGSSSVINSIVAMIQAAIAAAKATAGIRSPSKEFGYVGEMMDRGLAEGVGNYAYMVKSTVSNTIDSILESTTRSVENSKEDMNAALMEAFNLDPEYLKLRVVVDADTSRAINSLDMLQTRDLSEAVNLGNIDGKATFNQVGSREFMNSQYSIDTTVGNIYGLVYDYMAQQSAIGQDILNAIVSGGSGEGVAHSTIYNQTINSTRPVSRLSVYRATKSLIGQKTN